MRSIQDFDHWLRRLKDRQGRSRILSRLDRLAAGNLGDVKPVGGGVLELRPVFGPGYRGHLTRRGNQLVLLLCGGGKASNSYANGLVSLVGTAALGRVLTAILKERRDA